MSNCKSCEHLRGQIADLLTECREHRLPMLASDPAGRINPHGTFADALRNLADDVDESGWASWLRSKADSLEAAVANAAPTTPPPGSPPPG